MDDNFKYRVDLCVCIDLSCSTENTISILKKTLLDSVFEDVRRKYFTRSKKIEMLRIRFIGFAYQTLSICPLITQSPFYIFPTDKIVLEAFVNNLDTIKTNRGESPGLEAIELAIKSQWTTLGDKQRHMIIMFSSNKANGSNEAFSVLTSLWDKQKHNTRHSTQWLIMFAPDNSAWTDIATHWDNTVHYPSKEEEDWVEIGYQTILSAIVNSI